MFKKIAIFIGLACLAVVASSAQAKLLNQPLNIDQQAILQQAPKLNPHALQLAINGYKWAMSHGKVTNNHVLTIIDFTRHSAQKRLWVIDLHSCKILLHTYTTQGKNSGATYANHFSNQPGSYMTSLGLYQTLNSYQGKHGYSMRLNGLEQGINNNALARAIVVHPAYYASSEFIHQYHRAGRSWGCFAVAPAVSKQFINLTKNGSIIFAYSTALKHDPHLV